MILRNPFRLKYFLYPKEIDMRKSWSGLLGLVENDLEMNAIEGQVFIFFGRNKRLVKILYWDGNGFAIWMKRLEKGIFPFQENSASKISISKSSLFDLLSGVDIRRKHKVLLK